MRGVLGGKLCAVAVVAALTTLSACGDPDSEQADDPAAPTSSTPMSTTPPPVLESPIEPPSSPTDPQPHDVVAGQVVRGGAGPCYGVETDDGMLYAVHSTSAGELAVGTTVLVKLGPTVPKMDCGPGEPVSASRIDVVG